MNNKMAFKAELIANKIKKKLKSPFPAMMFHDEAYRAIMNGKEADYLTKDELKRCEKITEDRAKKIIDSLF